MEWITPVYDRVESDVVYGNPKGSLTPDTLNRLENNIAVLTEMLDALGSAQAGIIVREEPWTRNDYLLLREFNRIKQNILYIRRTGIIQAGTPTIELSAKFAGVTWQELNAMERILFDVHQLLKGVPNHQRYLGTFVCGKTVSQYIRIVR